MFSFNLFVQFLYTNDGLNFKHITSLLLANVHFTKKTTKNNYIAPFTIKICNQRDVFKKNHVSLLTVQIAEMILE